MFHGGCWVKDRGWLAPYLYAMHSEDGLFYLRFPREDGAALLAQGIEDAFEVQAGEQVDWTKLNEWLSASNDWVFGWIGYDVRRSIEQFGSEELKPSAFPQLVFFRPVNLFKVHEDSIETLKGTWSDAFDSWLKLEPEGTSSPIVLEPAIDYSTYTRQVESLKREIALGNVYELNYCMPFEANAVLENPEQTWKRMYAKTQAPFSAFASYGPFHVLCTSPERYLKRSGNRVISQPIKGTIRRGANTEEDEHLKARLSESKKERAENVMIVDLVRNDLSRCAERNSVEVEELFGVHTFKTVHHLISTIRCDVRSETSVVDLLRASFPMGSMTGAPKVSAMQLIAQHEVTERGVYSGSIGYIEPSGDFDFNVVIRSVQYDASSQYVSCHVGGAITALCNAEDEYNECLLKAEAVLGALRGE